MKGNRFFNSLPKIINTTQKNELHPWLVTGLTDSEGCFSARLAIIKIKFYIAPVFSIYMHLSEIDLLNNLKYFFGVGTVRIYKVMFNIKLLVLKI